MTRRQFGTSQGILLTLTSEFLQTFLTEDVEALEEFGGGVGVEADWTCQLVGQLLEGLIGNTGTLSHVSQFRPSAVQTKIAKGNKTNGS